ncbi:MAG: endo alpha-1,4 polygalactosaminidase, partial [Burkholderiales bacterium]
MPAGLFHIGFRLSAAFAILIAFCTPALVQPRLNDAKSWAYQLQNVDPEEIRQSPYDVVVIDYGFDQRNGTAFPREVVDLMRTRPDGRRRMIFAYISVGEAENYRYYWKASWAKSPPEWLGSENCRWRGDHRVRFWMPGWRELMFGAPRSYLGRIVALGFDGVFLDRVDIHRRWLAENPQATADMVTFVAGLSGWAKAQ